MMTEEAHGLPPNEAIIYAMVLLVWSKTNPIPFVSFVHRYVLPIKRESYPPDLRISIGWRANSPWIRFPRSFIG